ncbi:MAG: hypothetical protein ACYTGZ_22455, partial [Planctomycetota bacterium]
MKQLCASLIVVAMCTAGTAHADSIVGVSVPVNSMTSGSLTTVSGVWSVTAPPYPLPVGLGVGNLINPAPIGGFALHDHHYI